MYPRTGHVDDLACGRSSFPTRDLLDDLDEPMSPSQHAAFAQHLRGMAFDELEAALGTLDDEEIHSEYSTSIDYSDVRSTSDCTNSEYTYSEASLSESESDCYSRQDRKAPRGSYAGKVGRHARHATAWKGGPPATIPSCSTGSTDSTDRIRKKAAPQWRGDKTVEKSVRVMSNLLVMGEAWKTGGSTEWLVLSDARVKEVLGDFELGTSTLAHLSPRLFRYKGQPAHERPYVGFIAQELPADLAPFCRFQSELTPAAVVMDPTGRPSAAAAPTERLYLLDLSALQFVLLNAATLLNQAVAQLARDIDALRCMQEDQESSGGPTDASPSIAAGRAWRSVSMYTPRCWFGRGRKLK